MELIGNQLAGNANACPEKMSDLYAQDVRLISKEGKLYYLPSLEAKEA